MFQSETGGVEEQAYSRTSHRARSGDSGQEADALTLLATHISAILKFGTGAAKIHSRSSLDYRTDGRHCFGRHHMSHTARSGQAAHSRRVHLCCGLIGHPSPITGPILRGAAKRRTLQEGLRSRDRRQFGLWVCTWLGQFRSGRFGDTVRWVREVYAGLVAVGRDASATPSIWGGCRLRDAPAIPWSVWLVGDWHSWLGQFHSRRFGDTERWVCVVHAGWISWVAVARDAPATPATRVAKSQAVHVLLNVVMMAQSRGVLWPRMCFTRDRRALTGYVLLYLGQSYLGQFLLRPILLRPILLRPGLLRPSAT